MGMAAVGPRHFEHRRFAEVFAANVAAAVAIVVGVDQLAPAFDLVECEPQDFFGSRARPLGHHRLERLRVLPGQHIGKHGRQGLAT